MCVCMRVRASCKKHTITILAHIPDIAQHDVKDSLDSFLHFRTCVNFVYPIFIWIYSRPFSQ